MRRTKNILYNLLFKKLTLAKWQWDMWAIFIFFFGVGCSLFMLTKDFVLPNVFASTSPWTQTDWSGGGASGVVTGTVNTYSAISGVSTATSGQASLSQTSGWSSTYSSWSHRQTVSVSNSGSSLTDFQVKVPVNYDSDMQADFDDIRFTTTSDTALDFWLDHKTDSTSAVFWVKMPSVPSGSSDFYMYYGNSGASSASNGNNTFIFFDAFSGNSLDESKWTIAGNASDVSISNKLIMNAGGCGGWARSGLYSDTTFDRTNGLVTEFKYKPTGWTSPGCIDQGAVMLGFLDQTTNINYNTVIHGIYDVWNGDSNVVYENGSGSTPSGFSSSLTINQEYELKIEARPTITAGAKYYYSTNNGDTYTNFYTTSSVTTSPVRIGFVNYNQNFEIYNWRIRQYVAIEPSTSVATEETKYSNYGTLTSNTFNAEFPADWGNLTYSTSGTGAVTVKVRTDSNSDMSGATAWASCLAISSGTDLTANNCVDDMDQYLEYQVTLQPGGGSTSVFENISIAFSPSDQVDPANATNVTIAAIADSGAWTKTDPVINFSSGYDNVGGVGLAGYCIALDEVTITGTETSHALDPEISAGSLLNALDDGITNSSTCPYIVGPGNITSINLASISGLNLNYNKRYYFSIKAVDLAGNVYSGTAGTYRDLIDFKYDNNPPGNVSYISAPSTVFGNVDDMFFSWPISGAGISSDSESGVIGWQYSLDSGVTWRGPDTESTLGITYIEDNSVTSSHTLSDSVDRADISEGINTIYFRTVDEAGNFSSSSTYRTAPLNFGGEAPSFDIACDLNTGVTVTPSTSTSNSFALSWDEAHATGSNIVAGYYYMINTNPPSTLSTLESNSTSYIPVTSTSVSTTRLTGSVKGTNTVYVVAYDNDGHYSQSNCLKGTYTLNSTLPDPVANLSVTDASIKSDELWRASLTWSEPSYKGTGTLTYVIQRSTDNSTWSTITTTTGTSYTDTVSNSSTYYYRIGTYDTTSESQSSPTYSTSVSVFPKGTWDSAPGLSSGPIVTGITTKKATVNWSTSRASDTKVQYGISSGSYFNEEPSTSTQTTSHEIKLTNLSPGTTYYYKAKWTDEDGNTGISSEKTFSTAAAPVVTDPKIDRLGLANVIIQYTVKGASSVKFYYGKTAGFGATKEVSTSTSETTYTTTLEDLEDGTKYYYKINTFDSEGSEYESNILTFETLPRPRIADVKVQQVARTAQPSVLVTWTTNTEVSSIITYYPQGNTADARDEVNVALKKGEHQMIIRGLFPQTRYAMIIKGRDKAGNEAESDVQTFTTATDTRPPQIAGLKVEGANTSQAASGGQKQQQQLVVSWNTDEAATSQVEFGEGTGSTYSQKTQEDSNLAFNHVVVISGLSPSKVYHLRVLSKDKAGNVGNSVDTVTITPKSSDNALDLVITNLQQIFGFIGR